MIKVGTKVKFFFRSGEPISGILVRTPEPSAGDCWVIQANEYPPTTVYVKNFEYFAVMGDAE